MNNERNHDVLRDLLRGLSSHDFLRVGINEIAYVRPFEDGNDESSYAVYAADGTRLSILESKDLAIAAAHHNSLVPVTLH